MAGSFEGVFKGDEFMNSGVDSMNNAFGSAGASKGGPLESPEENFIGSNYGTGSPANALPSVSNGATPSGDGSFDCMADSFPKF